MGYVVIYPIWDTTTTPWSFKEFQFCDQRAFQYDKATLRELRMRKDGEIEASSLPPGFVVHYPQIRARAEAARGMIRLVAVNHLFKTSDINDFMAFAETFGMPLRIGNSIRRRLPMTSNRRYAKLWSIWGTMPLACSPIQCRLRSRRS